MKMNGGKLMTKKGLLSIVIVGGSVFTIGNANANFFDALNDSLKSVSAELEKAKEGLSNAKLKLNEASKQVDGADAKLAAEQQKLDVIKRNGEAAVADVKSTAQDTEDLAASLISE